MLLNFQIPVMVKTNVISNFKLTLGSMAAHALDTLIYGSHSPISSFFLWALWTSCHPGSFHFTPPPPPFTLVNHHTCHKSSGPPTDKGKRSLQTSLCCRSAAIVSAAALNDSVLRWDRVALPMPLLWRNRLAWFMGFSSYCGPLMCSHIYIQQVAHIVCCRSSLHCLFS